MILKQAIKESKMTLKQVTKENKNEGLYIYKDQNVTVSRNGADFDLRDVDTGELIYTMDREEFKNFNKFKMGIN
jgi:hypothetical protein